MLVDRCHLEWVEHHGLGCGEPFHESVEPIGVHQKADASAMHAEDRHALREEAMQGLQHEAIAAQRNDDFGALRGNAGVPLAQLFESLLRGVGLGRDDSNPRRRRTSHPPVTLIWRATAGR